jgi:tetratricopeptide (TPR) repeat protein
VIGALAIVLFASGAAASDEGEAKAAVRRGLAASAKNDHETALAEYRTAQKLVPDANLPYRYAAEALVALERYEEAIAEYERYLAVKPDVSDAEEIAARIAAARAKIHGALTVTSSPAGADVLVDGARERVGVTPLAGLKLRRGKHDVVVRLAGKKDVVLSAVVRGGETTTLAADFAELAAPPAPQKREERPEIPRARPAPVIGWWVLGGGAVLLAGSFAVDAFVLAPAYDEWDRKRREGDPSAIDDKKKVTTLQTTLIVGYSVGALATITGATILLWPRSPRTAGVTPAIGPSSVGVTGTF